MVSFAASQRLWLLGVIGVLAILVLLRHWRRQQEQRQLASPAVWYRLMGGIPATGCVRLLAWCAAGASLVLALAQPHWGVVGWETPVKARDVVLALDVSHSMLCADLQPSRLAWSVRNLIKLLPKLEGNRVGIVVFAGDAMPLVPLTADLAAVRVSLASIEPEMGLLPGTNVERAVHQAIALLPPEGTGRVIVFVSDGESLDGDLEAARRELAESQASAVAVLAGTATGGPIALRLPDNRLRYKLSSTGQPVLTRANRAVLAQLVSPSEGEVLVGGRTAMSFQLLKAITQVRAREQQQRRTVQLKPRFPLFLLLTAGLVTLGFAIPPWRKTAAMLGLAVVVVTAGCRAHGPAPGGSPSATAAADEPAVAPRWWHRIVPGGKGRLQRAGVERWRRGDLQGARRCFVQALWLAPEDPAVQYDLGTTLAALGDLEHATRELGQAHRRGNKGAAYNLGTALLMDGKLEEGAFWLERAVLIDPDDSDAKYNFELSLRLRAQQDLTSGTGDGEPSSGEEHADAEATQPADEPARISRQALYDALERADQAARLAARPKRRATVERDW